MENSDYRILTMTSEKQNTQISFCPALRDTDSTMKQFMEITQNIKYSSTTPPSTFHFQNIDEEPQNRQQRLTSAVMKKQTRYSSLLSVPGSSNDSDMFFPRNLERKSFRKLTKNLACKSISAQSEEDQYDFIQDNLRQFAEKKNCFEKEKEVYKPRRIKAVIQAKKSCYNQIFSYECKLQPTNLKQKKRSFHKRINNCIQPDLQETADIQVKNLDTYSNIKNNQQGQQIRWIEPTEGLKKRSNGFEDNFRNLITPSNQEPFSATNKKILVESSDKIDLNLLKFSEFVVHARKQRAKSANISINQIRKKKPSIICQTIKQKPMQGTKIDANSQLIKLLMPESCSYQNLVTETLKYSQKPRKGPIMTVKDNSNLKKTTIFKSKFKGRFNKLKL